MNEYITSRAVVYISPSDNESYNNNEYRNEQLSKIQKYKKLLKTQTLPAKIEDCKRKIKAYRIKSKEDIHLGSTNVTVALRECRYNFYTRDFTIDTDQVNAKNIKDLILKTIRGFREDQKRDKRSKTLFYPGINASKYGGVYLTSNSILMLLEKKKTDQVFADKAPTELIKYVGIELEFCATIAQTDLVKKLIANKLYKFVQLKSDGSLRPKDNETGYELAILLKEKTFKKDLKVIANILTEIGAKTEDRRCGMHVHLDMRKRNKQTVFHNLVACQRVLFKLIHPSRKDNEFCEYVFSRKFPKSFKGNRKDRYKTINASSYYKHKTIEIRMHEGVTDFGTISNWVDLLIKIANCRKPLKNSISQLTTLKNKFNLNKKLYNYVVDKSCYWQVNRGEGLEQPTSRPVDSAWTISPVNPVPRNGYSTTSAINMSVPLFNASPSFSTSTTLTIDNLNSSMARLGRGN